MKKSFLVFILFAGLASADRGMLPILPDISVYEPGQKAIIAWNGKQEVMILAVDAYADTECKVLEILPLPSEPKVDTGNVESFKVVQKLIMKHTPKFPFKGKGPPSPFERVGEEGVEILFHKEIGAHNITCVKALKYQEFVNWTHNFIKSQGIDTISPPPELQYIIGEYLSQKITYFVFDIVELGKTTSSIAPLIYEFSSPYLFFPLSISRLAKGDTRIQLFLLSEYPPWLQSVSHFEVGRYRTYGLKGKGGEIMFEITKDELKTIAPLLTKLFQTQIWFTALRFDGSISNLVDDLKIRKFYKIIEY